MRSSARRRDDDDVIRARLRALLAEGRRPPSGWVPDDEDEPAEAGAWPDDPAETVPVSLEAAPELPTPAGLGRHRLPGPAARLDPGRRGAWSLWAVAVLAALLVAGWTWTDRPAVERVTGAGAVATGAPSATSSAPPTPSASNPVVVSVVGAVAAPGLVTLPPGARVADALAAAGGLLPDADPASVNAAAVLIDGEQVVVARPGAVPVTGGAGPAAGGPLDLNTATVADLDALPGIGPVLAQRIVDHRTAQGPFTSVEQLDDVDGIGPAIYADLQDRVTVR
ncbi:ComEA family DNA-binding protein [Modestobacter marinus]|uniref:ComEA family DNA-binding protein n=1 Tax=Modestobacter marinus TaxID=477641 RepID=UPI001C987622|nr:ComEA family DNA-binding protein [Modestobacter marinus]